MKTEKRPIDEQLKAGDLILIDPKLTDKEGLQAQIAMFKKDYEALKIAALLSSKKDKKKVAALIRAVLWLVVRCQKTGVRDNAVIELTAKDFPPLAMSVHPMSATDMRPVLVVQKKKEVAK